MWLAPTLCAAPLPISPLFQEDSGSKTAVTLAARLLELEQAIPDAAIAADVSAEAWTEWE